MTHAQVNDLVVEMRNGSTVARDKIIEAHVGIAFNQARKYGSDEALSDGLLALVTGTDNFAKSDSSPAAITQYLVTAVSMACYQHKRNRKGYSRAESIESEVGEKSKLFREELHRSRSNTKLAELLETVDSICEDEIDRRIVSAKLRGLGIVDTAKRVGKSTGFVSTRLTQLELRYRVQEKMDNA